MIAAIVLAAGRSSRMGSTKMLADLGGRSLVEHAAAAALGSGAAPVIVVIGHQAAAVRDRLTGFSVRFVDNPAYADGLSTSLKAGLAALPETAKGVVICLGDMPAVSETLIRRMILAYDPAKRHEIVVPVHQGRRGNPVLWGRRFFPALMRASGDLGGRQAIADHADSIAEIAADDDGIFLDIDTPQALAMIENRFGIERKQQTMNAVFGAESTTDEVLQGIDLTGKRVLVTGVSAGLGVETARALIAHGASVVGTARDLDKARAATSHIGRLELTQLDLASLGSVRACADRLNAAGTPFDVVIANAGVMACPQGKTNDGFETQFGTNHLGHFVLINRIAPLLKPGSRLVNLASAGHRFSDVDLDDPGFERTTYTEFGAYGRSKTSNILFAVEFDRRHKARGIRATAVHPGGIQTELARHMPAGALDQMIETINANRSDGAPTFRWKSIPQGAATSIWSGFVASADLVGGKYCEDCHVAEIIDDPNSRSGVRTYALDPDRAKALWTLSEEMVGERFSK